MSQTDPPIEPNEPATEQHDLNWAIPEWTMAPLAVAVAVVLIVAFGFNALLWSLVPFSVLLAAVTVIDFRELRIPNRLTGPAAIAAGPLLVLASLADWPDVSLTRALFGALALGAGYLILALIYPAGMGLGDVKLAPLLGAQLALFGWVPLVRGVIFTHMSQGVIAIVLLLARRAGMKTGLPLGPFMCAGAIAALLFEAWGSG